MKEMRIMALAEGKVRCAKSQYIRHNNSAYFLELNVGLYPTAGGGWGAPQTRITGVVAVRGTVEPHS